MPRLRLFLNLAAFIFCATAALAQTDVHHPPVDPHNYHPESLSRPIDLTSAWLIHEGDDPHFADPSLDDSQWQVIQTGRSLSTYGIVHPNFLWYRTHLHLPPHLHSQAILLRGFIGSEQIFVNGVLTGPSREFPPGGLTTMNFDRQSSIPDNLLATGDLTIAVRAQVQRAGASAGTSPGFYSTSSLLLGDESVLADQSLLYFFRDLTSNLTTLALNGMVLLIAIALALTLRKEPEYFALCVLLAGLFFTNSQNIWRSSHDLYPNRWMFLSGDFVRCLTLLAGIEFARIVLRRPRTRWLIGYEALLVALAVLDELVYISTYPRPHSQIFLFTAWIISLLAVLPIDLGLPIYALIVWRRQRNFDALLLSIPLLVRTLFIYFQYGFAITSILLAKPSYLPDVPSSIFYVGWTEIGDFCFLIALLIFLILRTVRIARARAALAAELEAARTVQQLLLAGSSHPTPGFLIESVYLPASEVGGDFFLVSPSPDGSLVAILGDVSGKGLLAAMRVSMILGVLRRESSRNPAKILANLNEALLTQGDTGFTTACCIRLELAGNFTIANAGHISPYVTGRQISQELPGSPALPLGLVSGQAYDLLEGELTTGQRLILMSDGVPEARSTKGELYGFDRLPNLIQLPAHDIADVAQRFGQEDDITVLTLALA